MKSREKVGAGGGLPKHLTATARYLNMCRETLYKLIANGKTPARRVGGRQKEVCEVLQALQAENREPQPIIIERTPNGKTITQYDNVDSSKSDYQQVHSTAQFFARKMGRNVEILPNLGDGKRFDYKAIFSDLMGTRYEGKCPDLKVEGLGYVEVKGFEEGAKGKRALSNMLKRSLKQSDRVVIQRHPEWTERYLKQGINTRIREGVNIEMVWVQEQDGSLTVVFDKKAEG